MRSRRTQEAQKTDIRFSFFLRLLRLFAAIPFRSLAAEHSSRPLAVDVPLLILADPFLELA
jgi:hypothetical protein